MSRPPTAGRASPSRARRWPHGLDAIVAQDSSFDPRHFISGARGAYEMIVLAFANGDRRALKDLLSSEVYESFEAVIKDREKHEQKTETRFVSIDKAELVGAEARDRAAQLTVRFVSQMISVTRDKTGTIVDGNPDKVADITDVWTFARDTSSRDPNWKLVGTGSAQLRRDACGGCVWRDRFALSLLRWMPLAARHVAFAKPSQSAPAARHLPYPELELPLPDHRQPICAGCLGRSSPAGARTIISPPTTRFA